MFNKVATDIFNLIILPRWQQDISHSASPRLWQRSFVRAAKQSNIISVELAVKLSSQPSLLTLMLNSFDSQADFPSARSFAICIAYEISQKRFNTDAREVPELWRLRSFSSAVRAQWLASIDNSFLLRNRFQDVYNQSPLKTLTTGSDCPLELDLILCNSAALYREYVDVCQLNTQLSATQTANKISFNASRWKQRRHDDAVINL